MPWFMKSSEILEVMCDIAGDQKKLAAFRRSPERYLDSLEEVSDQTKQAILRGEREAVIDAMLDRFEDES